MVKWGTMRCDEAGVPAFLVATMNALSFYKKAGFESAVPLSMRISVQTNDGCATQKYQEMGMIYRPECNRAVGKSDEDM
jgi:hypothetical protein